MAPRKTRQLEELELELELDLHPVNPHPATLPHHPRRPDFGTAFRRGRVDVERFSLRVFNDISGNGPSM
jgi:hypothetical protein